eukprot:152585_1
MQPTNPSSNELFVRLLKEQSNRLNCQCQQFQTEIRSFISATMDDSSINDKLSKVLDNYSTSLNKICVEYLIKLESQISHVSSKPQSVKPNASTRRYSCHLCDVSYTTQSSLCRHNRNNHSQLSDDDGDFVCGLCANSDYEQSSLSRIKLQCDICGKCFKNAAGLGSHKVCCRERASHSSDSPWKCDICDRVFQMRYTLARHKTTHSDDRPFRCEYCQKGFTRHPYLMQHIIRVHKKNPWKCDQCDQAFRIKKELKEHVELDHKTKGSEQTETVINDDDTSMKNERFDAGDETDEMDADEMIHDERSLQRQHLYCSDDPSDVSEANSVLRLRIPKFKQTNSLLNRRL